MDIHASDVQCELKIHQPRVTDIKIVITSIISDQCLSIDLFPCSTSPGIYSCDLPHTQGDHSSLFTTLYFLFLLV